ncbi:MAG TPA: regulatory protein RecX, partial [Pseudomonadales bacterium]|nr:regulatory protein RecX [Pseudomonadales bacterium]
EGWGRQGSWTRCEYIPADPSSFRLVPLIKDSIVKKDNLETRAVRLLARREHSRSELKRKLKKADDGSLGEVLDQLEEKGYQSDRRYCEVLVRSRISSGHGPLKIRFELKQKGVDAALIDEVISEQSPDWTALARRARERRFGESLPEDRQEVLKQLRYLVGRGFEQSQLRSIFRVEEDV